jgi:hypothetical protein
MGGLILGEYLLRVLMRRFRLMHSKMWPTVSGNVTSTEYPKAGSECEIVAICYEYKLDGQLYQGCYKNPFIFPVLAEKYAARFPSGTELIIRVKPGEPSKSVMYGQASTSPTRAGISSGPA